MSIRAYARKMLCCGWLLIAMLSVPWQSVAQEDVPEVVRRLLEEGNRKLRQNQIDQAIEVLQEARQLGPGTVQVYLDLGAAWVRMGDLESARETFEAGLKRDPRYRELLYNAAVICLRLNDPAAALAHVSQALEAHGERTDLLLVKSGSLARLGQHEESFETLKVAEQAEPRSARIQFSLGNQFHRLGRLEDAVRAFGKAIRLDPEQTRALYNLGAVLVEMKRYSEAREAYEEALKPFYKALKKGQQIDPIHAVAFSNLGAAYSQSGDWERAAEVYKTASKVDPTLADSQLNLGFAFFQLQKWKKARQAYEQAVELDPDLSLAYIQLGEIHHQQGDCAVAVGWFQKGLPKLQATERLRAMEGMARCYTDLGRVDEAEGVFRRVLAEAPTDPEVLKDFGSVLRRRGRLEEAREALAKSLELRPGDLPTLLQALAVEESVEDRAAQVRLLQTLVDQHGNVEHLWPARQRLALMYLRAARWAEAQIQLEKLLRSPQLPAAEKSWVRTLEGLTAWVVGISAREEIDPSGALVPRAVLRAEQGDLTEALALLVELPSSGALDYLRGLLLWSDGRLGEAREMLQGAERIDLSEPALDIVLGSLDLSSEARRPMAKTVQRLEKGIRPCDENPTPSKLLATSSEGRVVVRRPVSVELCEFGKQVLRRARLSDGLDLMGRDPEAAISRARAVLAEPSDEQQRALALFVEGSGLLVKGRAREAVTSLQRSLDLFPSASWQASTGNNLGMAWARLGDFTKAERFFRAARPSSIEAVLNLAILIHEQKNDPQTALGLYEEYIRAGGPRREEVQGWVHRLRELYP